MKISSSSNVEDYNKFLVDQNNEFNININETDKSILDYDLPIAHYISNDKDMSRGIALELKNRITNL